MEANEHRLALQLNLNAGQPLTFFADTRLTYQNLLLTVQDLNLKTRRKKRPCVLPVKLPVTINSEEPTFVTVLLMGLEPTRP